MLCTQSGCCLFQRYKFTCCVCFEHTNNITNCFHPLCKTCEDKLNFKKCPLCRRVFDYTWKLQSTVISLDCAKCGIMTPFVTEEGHKLCIDCGRDSTLHLEFGFGELYGMWARRWRDPRWNGPSFWHGVKLKYDQRRFVYSLNKTDSREHMRYQVSLVKGDHVVGDPIVVD